MINYEQTITQARSGNNAALQALYDETINSVWYIVTRLVDRHEDAEDLVQDVFLTAFSRLDQLSEPQAFPKWVHRIATNTATNHLKKKRPVLFDTDEQETQMLNSIPAVGEDFLPEEFAFNHELRDMLMSAIAQLPEKQRMAIFLHYYEGTPVKELAETLNVGENTVKSRLNAGRAGIRKQLEKMGVSGAIMSVLAIALRNDAAAALVPAPIRTAVWSSLQASLAAGSAGAGAAATVAKAAATTAATATTAKAAAPGAVGIAAIFSSLWGKIAAGVVAAAIVLGGGAAVVNTVVNHGAAPGTNEPFQSKYGVPEEMGFCEAWIDSMDDPVLSQSMLDLLTHDFGSPVTTYEFNNGSMKLQYYPDGYAKFYLARDFLDRYPFPEVSDDVSSQYHMQIFDATGRQITFLYYQDIICSGGNSEDEPVDLICSTNYHQNGDYVYYTFWPMDRSLTPAYIICQNGIPNPDNKGDVLFRVECTGTSVAQPEPEPEPETPGLTLDETLLNLTGTTFDEATKHYGNSTYMQDMGYYYFPDSNVGLAWAYGKDTGVNYVTCPLSQLIPNCPETLSVEQLVAVFGGGAESYSEMEGEYLFSLDYKGGPLGIYKDSSGQYGRNSWVWHNCANRVDQTPASTPEPEVKPEVKPESKPETSASTGSLLNVLGKTKPEMEAILGHSLTYGSEFGGLEYLVPSFYQTSSIAYMSGSGGSGTCIGFLGVPLSSIIPNCPASLNVDQLKAKLGNTYKDPWAGSDRYDTVYQGYVITIFPTPDGSGKYTPNSLVSACPTNTTIFKEFGTYWNNYCESTEAHMEIISKSNSSLTCTIDMGQRTYGMRVTESGRITLSSADGKTYTATGLKDSWGSTYNATITFDRSTARITIDYTHMDQMANYSFDDSFILHRGS